ncbi:MAG: cytochrome P450 [Azospirillaceae bacterium]
MTISAPIPAMPVRHKETLSPLRAMAAARRNFIGVWPEEAYYAGFLAQKFFRRWLFVANSPRTVRHVMVSNVANYPKSDEMKKALGPLIGNSMLLSDGEIWRRQRRAATPLFHGREIRRFADMMVSTTTEMADDWARGLASGERTERDMAEEMARVTAEVICRTMFSSDLGDRARVIYESFTDYLGALRSVEFDEFMGLPGWLLPRLPRPKARRALRRIHQVLDEMINNRRGQEHEIEDLLSLILRIKDEDTGRDRPHGEIRDELSVFFFAGHETTATSLAWTWYLLSLSPVAEAKFHAEIDQVLAGRPPTYEDLGKLHYVRSVFEEAMRLYPPIPVLTRKAREDDQLGGRHVPAGSLVAVVPWLLHRHRGLWRDPDAFDPDRFYYEKVEPPPGVEPPRPRHKLAYIPFGAGPRTCIGLGFAMTEGPLILATLGQRFRMRLRAGHPVEPYSRLTLRPRHGLPMTIERR